MARGIFATRTEKREKGPVAYRRRGPDATTPPPCRDARCREVPLSLRDRVPLPNVFRGLKPTATVRDRYAVKSGGYVDETRKVRCG
jgi:hypothetical protein